MSRRQRRYERRMKQRKEKREQSLKKYLSFENVCSYQSLYDAVKGSAKGVRWKESVQRYNLNIVSNIVKTRKNLLDGKDIRQGFIYFDICERGKIRHIRSVHFRERVVQKTLCKNALAPVMTYNLITDNGASQKGKGTLFATKRLVKYLRWHYRKFGNNGYVLLVDFKSYFDNIEHKPLKNLISKYFIDEKIRKYSFDFIDAFGEKGLGLGSETSQIDAVAYINKIDHYIKEVARIKGYGRYMDDSYIIHPSKKYLEELLIKLEKLYEEFGIKLNKKKTIICDLKHGFTFLKTRFFVTDSGKVILKPCRNSITRERKKLKKQAKLLEKGILTQEDIDISFVSWKGSMAHRNAKRTIRNMEKLYNDLFKVKGEKE